MIEKYCYRCKRIMPFLNENEWVEISPYLLNATKSIIDYLKKNNCDLKTAMLNCKPAAMQKFEELTGIPNIHFEIIYHHRLKDLGGDCKKCGFPLRSLKAKLCANCWHLVK